jgi:hypothetical protein
MVLPPLTTKWDKTKYLEKRVHMGIEYRKCNQCGLSKKRFNAAKALLHVCKEFGKYQHVSILTATILPVYLNQSKVEKLSIISTSYKLKKVCGNSMFMGLQWGCVRQCTGGQYSICSTTICGSSRIQHIQEID